MFTNKVYDVLKIITIHVLPACGALYAALAGIWGLPYAEAIVGTIAAVTTFLGALIGISSYQYNKRETADDEEEEPRG